MGSVEKDTLRLLGDLQESAEKAKEGDTVEKERCLDVLKQLEKSAMTTEVLAKTQAGKKVRALVKHGDEELSWLARKVVAQWKSMVQRTSSVIASSQSAGLGSQSVVPVVSSQIQSAEGGTTGQGINDAQQVDTKDQETRTADKILQSPSTASSKQMSANLPPTRTGSSLTYANDSVVSTPSKSVTLTGDVIRDKIRNNLMQSLEKAREEGVQEGDSADLACKIELAMYESLDRVSAKYKAKFRQVHFNLKDSSNPDLRKKVLKGDITPNVLITLSPEDLASDAKREENQRIREKKLFDSAPSSVKLATTDQFQCGKCRQRKCTYYQMQTRSADEPMTTFVRCTVCNNSWKFC
eukprot:jgi/Picsp_1/6616/NSC_03959-R1_protein